jgi:hypothetical protein
MSTRFASDGSTSDRSSNGVTESNQLRGFFNTRRAITSGDSLLRRWLLILGPELFTLIKVLCSILHLFGGPIGGQSPGLFRK